MFSLTKKSSLKEICSEAYSLLNKYGYMNGDDLLPEEEEIVCCASNKLASSLGEIDGWQPIVIQTVTHNPFYIGFKNSKANTKEIRDFWDLDVKVRRRIEKRIEELGNLEW